MADPNQVSLGVTMNGNTIRSVERETSGYVSGLNVNDEIIAINQYRVNGSNLSGLLNQFKVGDKIEILVSRDNLMERIQVELLPKDQKTYLINAKETVSSLQKTQFEKWFYKL